MGRQKSKRKYYSTSGVLYNLNCLTCPVIPVIRAVFGVGPSPLTVPWEAIFVITVTTISSTKQFSTNEPLLTGLKASTVMRWSHVGIPAHFSQCMHCFNHHFTSLPTFDIVDLSNSYATRRFMNCGLTTHAHALVYNQQFSIKCLGVGQNHDEQTFYNTTCTVEIYRHKTLKYLFIFSTVTLAYTPLYANGR